MLRISYLCDGASFYYQISKCRAAAWSCLPQAKAGAHSALLSGNSLIKSPLMFYSLFWQQVKNMQVNT